MRIKLNFPEKTHFSTTIPVRIGDINYGNHVGNDAVVSILQEARVQFLHSLNYTELNIEGVGLILTDLEVSYKKQLFYNTLMTVAIAIEITSSKGFDLYYKIEIKDNQIAVIAKTNMLCFDYTLQKIAAIPSAFLQKVQNLHK
jgi:acyl-CoA thioester hydrolase